MKLCVIMLDTHRTTMAIVNENEHVPYGRRYVEIELTQEQKEKLERKRVGREHGKDVFETMGTMWIED